MSDGETFDWENARLVEVLWRFFVRAIALEIKMTPFPVFSEYYNNKTW